MIFKNGLEEWSFVLRRTDEDTADSPRQTE
jgi:hypothetical protein